MEFETTLFAERAGGPASKVVGLYQMLLRRNLEHFFPDALLDLDGDRSFIEVDALGRRASGIGSRRSRAASAWRSSG